MTTHNVVCTLTYQGVYGVYVIVLKTSGEMDVKDIWPMAISLERPDVYCVWYNFMGKNPSTMHRAGAPS